jgi:putative FmdB family regulatory protein
VPIYEYQCIGCGKVHEIIQKFSDGPLEACPDCGGELRKLISNTSFVLKGSGWYADGYASGPGKEASKEKPAEKGSDKKPAEAKAKDKPKKDSGKKTEKKEANAA